MKYYGAAQACKMLGISPATLARWRTQNLISYKQISERKFVYPEEELERLGATGYMRAQKGKSPEEPTEKAKCAEEMANLVRKYGLETCIRTVGFLAGEMASDNQQD